MSNRVICIIDDDKIYQFASSKLLKKYHSDIDVICFDDGMNGLDFLRENASNLANIPDVLLLDINMPVIDGWTFLDILMKEIPAVTEKMRIYIVSSSIDTRDLEKVKEYDIVKEYLVKPLNSDDYNGLFD